MINYFLLLDKNLTTDQKVVSSNPAECAIKNPSLAEGFFMACIRPVRTHNLIKELSSRLRRLRRKPPKDGKRAKRTRQPRHYKRKIPPLRRAGGKKIICRIIF